jgi:23S rRNA pseudouridine1911/1915/1917 synthase
MSTFEEVNPPSRGSRAESRMASQRLVSVCCRVPRPNHIELGDRRDRIRIPILYEDRSVIALDKPAGWMLVPFNWQRTQWNLQAAILSAIRAGFFWAKSRNLKFLQNIHRLDAETTGILLFGRSPGAVETFGALFESRAVEKRYLAVVTGIPREPEWVCEARLGSAPGKVGRVVVDPMDGKPATTAFRVLASRGDRSLIEARPVTGRTHQIRVHLLESGHAIVGDELYGDARRPPRRSRHSHTTEFPMALRSVGLSYIDPFRRKRVRIHAPEDRFLEAFGFKAPVSPA